MVVTIALHCCHAGLVIYMRDILRDTQIVETEPKRRFSGDLEVGGSPDTCTTDMLPHPPFPLTNYSFPPSHIFTKTLSNILLSRLPNIFSLSRQLQLEEVKKRQSRTLKSFWKKTFTSTPCLLPSPLSPISPPHHSRHNFWNIFTGISK